MQGAKLLVSLENEDAPDEVDSLTIPIAFVVGAVALNVGSPDRLNATRGRLNAP